jgi:two-component system OmpR family response regulator
MTTAAHTGAHILIVDDNPDIRDALAAYLRRQGLRASTVASAEDARLALASGQYSLMVLDVMMPGEGGLSLCRAIAANSQLPVILLTGMQTPADKLAGFESGADDYVVKPFDPPELLARIRSVLRRCAGSGSAPHPYFTTALPLAPPSANPYAGFAFDAWYLDVQKRELYDQNRLQPVPLSQVEYRLLRVLVDHPGTVLSRDRLMDLTVGDEALPFDRSIDSQVSRLRKKLERDPRQPDLLKTVWGQGYLFATDVVACALDARRASTST